MGRKRKYPPRFPAVDRAIQEMGGVREFCEDRFFSCVTYYAMQSGKHEPALPVIMEILDYTGLTFEEAFQIRQPKAPETELREKNIPVRGASTKPGKNRKEH